MGLLSKCALPERLDEAHEWKGTDDDQVWYMRWRLHVKHWFAFGPHCKQGLDLSFVLMPGLYVLPFTIWFTGWSWWYLFPLGIIPVCRRWRLFPTVIFSIRGKGYWRFENSNGNVSVAGSLGDPNKIQWNLFPRYETSMMSVMVPFYMSRCQYWSRWHFAIHWPFLVTLHWYPKAEDVLPVNIKEDRDGKVRSFYRGWHRDGDEIYWGDGGAGPNFK